MMFRNEITKFPYSMHIEMILILFRLEKKIRTRSEISFLKWYYPREFAFILLQSRNKKLILCS